ncbi:hypothetical protein HUK65_08845 [Rhodobacteraceae bacterium 2376]|uniref:Uncharacterized protein n=1 Tax=Rhabdonatronobacter sediminivivens TaxID=2743469 RepID=A0A7Z0KYD0_9RHOB|nr:hypothetical protein [Rhabdonatronobacter sediminivivens]NYS25100.1 hypothetical protein [Rhabdonatronobacter sediminivivens]
MVTSEIARVFKNMSVAVVLTVGAVPGHAQVDMPLDEVQDILSSDPALATITETILIPDEALDVVNAYYRRLFGTDVIAEHIRQNVPPNTMADLMDPDLNRHFPAAYMIADMFPMLSEQGVRYLLLPDLQTMLRGFVYQMDVMPAEKCDDAMNRRVPPEQGVEWGRAALMTMEPDALAQYLDAKYQSVLLAIDPEQGGRILSPDDMRVAQDTMLAEMDEFFSQIGGSFAGGLQAFESLPACEQVSRLITHSLELEPDTQDFALRLLVSAAAPD